MIDDLTALFKSMTKALDVLYVIEGVKPVSRIMASDEEIESYKDFLNKNGLSFAVSDFKVNKEVDENRFSNKGLRSKEGHSLIYISKSKEKAEKAKKAEHVNNHKELGRLLGYPDCCIEFFDKEFPKQSKKKNDYVLASLNKSKGFIFPFYNNVAARHLDLNLLSHFPCNFNCKESIGVAKRNLSIISKHSKEISTIFEGMLKGVVLYTDNGIFLLRNYKLEKNKVFYDKIMANMSNDFYKRLKDSKSIEIIDKNNIKMGNNKIRNIGVMVFV